MYNTYVHTVHTVCTVHTYKVRTGTMVHSAVVQRCVCMCMALDMTEWMYFIRTYIHIIPGPVSHDAQCAMCYILTYSK